MSRSPNPSSAAPERASHYTELQGASGRDVYFRPERYPRSELGSVGASVQVFLHGEVMECQLLDVSQNGFAFEWPLDRPIEVGAVLDRVVIRFDDHEAYRGEARVGSVRRDKVTSVGAALTDTLMNIEDVLQLRDLKAKIAEVQFRGLGLPEGPWRVPGHQRFKSLIAELRLFLEDTRDQLTELEAALPWHVSHAEHDSPARDALIERIRSGFVSELVRASNEIDAALRSASSSERDALRAYSERHLHDLLMLSPWMHRARHKPLGYPGDFELMNGLYGRHFSGATLFAKALNLAFVSTPAAQAVRCRKDLIKSQLSALLTAAEARGQPWRILSIAAGPAEEVYGLLAERSRIDVPVEIVLFDQDKGALAFSYARLNRLIAAKWQGSVRVVHLHDSITRLLRGATVLCTQGQFDAVYACGLFDYLQPHTWVSLCRSLYQSVAAGGTLYVGNMVPSSPSRWFMELHLDWQLEYRERAELIGLARRAAPDARIQILEEPTGVNPFVALSRE